MTLIRSGRPKVIRDTAPPQPGAAVSIGANTFQPFIFLEGTATTWARIRNLGAVPLRVFFNPKLVEGVTPASYKDFLEIPAEGASTDGGNPAFIEAPLELSEGEGGDKLILMGLGGACLFEVLLGIRVV